SFYRCFYTVKWTRKVCVNGLVPLFNGQFFNWSKMPNTRICYENIQFPPLVQCLLNSIFLLFKRTGIGFKADYLARPDSLQYIYSFINPRFGTRSNRNTIACL